MRALRIAAWGIALGSAIGLTWGTAFAAGDAPQAPPKSVTVTQGVLNAVEGAPPTPVRIAAEYADLDALLHGEQYTYRSGGRDPFASLVTRGNEQARASEEDPGVADLIIVGLLWGGTQRFALAETSQGLGLVLREGDEVRDGRVLSIGPDGVTFRQSAYGLTRRVTLPMVSREEVRDER